MVQSIRSTAFFPLPRRPASAPVKAVRRGSGKNMGNSTARRRLPRAPGGCSGPLPAAPLLLELGRRQVAQRRVDALAVVDVVEEPSQLPQRVGEVGVLRQRHLLLLERGINSLHYAQAFFAASTALVRAAWSTPAAAFAGRGA